MAARALAATRAAGLKPDVAYVPHPSATPAEIAQAAVTGAAAPLYTASPAPMGLADYGLSRGGYVYVADSAADALSVVNAATDAIVATVPVGVTPDGVAYDPGNGDVYVADGGSNQVSVVSSATNLLVTILPVGLVPVGVAYDPANGDIYVVDEASNLVSVIFGATNTLGPTIPAGAEPIGIAYDGSNGCLYVSDIISDTVTVIDGATNAPVATIGVGGGPSAVAYDSSNGYVYVTDEESSTVTVINGLTNTVFTTLYSGGTFPNGIAYDAETENLYVSNLGSGSVSIINGPMNALGPTFSVGYEPYGMTYSSQDGLVYVADIATDDVYVLGSSDAPPTSVDGIIPLFGQPEALAFGGYTNSSSPIVSVLNATSLLGTVDATGSGIQGQDLYQSSPDGFSIQMNAVLTNITLVGVHGYQFWTQDVVTYFPATGYMFLVSNVWNFSAPNDTVTNGTIFSHGPHGVNQYGTLGYYFANYTVPHPVSYPFDVTLQMNSSLIGGRNTVFFSAFILSATHPSEDFNASLFDWVVFNSISSVSPVPVTIPSNYTASGAGYNRVGLWDDFELVVTGPGGGSQVDLSSADATLSLAYGIGNASLQEIPSAYSYGSDTGETSTGANVAWSNVPINAPGGFVPYATMTTGPSVLTGLWGNNAPEGSTFIAIIPESPANAAFVFTTYLGEAGAGTPIVSEPEYTPTLQTTVFHLMPGTYTVEGLLSDYGPSTYNATLPLVQGVNITLTPDPLLGIYTPLWAFSNTELAAISQSGAGTPSNPYLLDNHQQAPLPSIFGAYNDYNFPVYPGVFLKGTTASVELNNSSSFLTYTSPRATGYEYLPPTNDLQMWFWGVSGVSIHNATNISGWFGRAGYFPLTFNSFNVIFYASQHNLIANNVFLTESQGLLLYANGTQFGSENFAGGNNTVWGNRFVQIDPPLNACPAYTPGKVNCTGLLPYNSGLGLEVAEGYDLIYNNLVATPTTAWLLPLNLYSGWPEAYAGDVWNITPEAAGLIHYAVGFPTIPLNGSIVGGPTQGGNSWWDYGVSLNWANGADNPTGVPYDENASNLIHPLTGYGSPLPGYSCTQYYCKTYIYPVGDEAPLPPAAAAVALGPHGLVSGTVWGVIASCEPTKGFPGGGPPGSVCCGPTKGFPGGGPPGCAVDPPALIFAQFETNASVVHLVLPDGEFNWTPIVPAGYTSSVGGSFVVSQGTPVSVTVPYASPGSAVLTFSEAGLPSGLTWQVTVNGAPMSLTTDGGTDSLSFTEPLGAKEPYAISPIAGWGQSTLPYTGTVSVSTAPTTEPTLVYTRVVYPVTFSESGLPTGLTWTVTFNGMPLSLTANGGTDTLTFAPEPNGTYAYSIAGNAGYHQSTVPYSGTETVTGAPLAVGVSYVPFTYGITFSETGLPSGLTWTVTVNGAPQSLTTNGATDTLGFPAEPNGTYAYSITGTAGYHESTVPYSGTVTVNGAPIAVSATYVRVTYPVTFSESGLPTGLTWKVTFNSVLMGLTTNGGTDTLTFAPEPNGTYAYSIAGNAGYHQSTVPYSGTETVTGAPLAVSVTYSRVTYSATFFETGLPAKLTWKVTVNGVTQSATTNGVLNWLTWTGLPNGTYAYSIVDNPGWHQVVIPYSGKFTVNGTSVVAVLVYLQVTYSVTFSESGLTAGLTWTVTVNGVAKHLTTNGGTDSLTWSGLPNGTYAYSIATVSGWHQSTLASSGSVGVSGASVSEPTLRYTH